MQDRRHLFRRLPPSLKCPTYIQMIQRSGKGFGDPDCPPAFAMSPSYSHSILSEKYAPIRFGTGFPKNPDTF